MLLVPIVSRLAKRYRWVDAPGLRKVHQTPIPRVGGLVFILATYMLVLPVFFLNNDIGRSFRAEQTEYIVLLLSGALIFMMGFIDDLRSVRAGTKLLCLVGASLAVCASGATVHSISVGSWFEWELGWLAWPMAVVWITTITVGMNFIDGLDGLAGGVAAIVCGTIAVMALWNGQAAMAVLILALLGSVVGFLFFNFHPAKIFMGDGGAMFLGFMIGAGSLVCQAKTCTLVGLAFPILVLGVPILDAGFTVIRRGVVYRRSIFAAEKGHLHHRLLEMGLQQRTVVIVIYAVTIISASIGMFMITAPAGWSLALLTGGVVFLFAVFAGLGAARIRVTIEAIKRILAISREKKEEKDRFEDAQLRMGEATSVKAWWESVCRMAEEMQFHSMELCLHYNSRLAATCEWDVSRHESQVCRTAEFVLPLQKNGSGMASEIKVRIRRNGSLEGPCRRVSLLGRLMDEFPPLSGNLAGQADTHIEYVGQDEEESSVVAVTERFGAERLVGVPTPINVMGVPVVPFESYGQALECVESTVESGRKSFWVAINPQKCHRAWQEPDLMDVLKGADVGFCDGVGISVASRILHGRGIDRCTGCDSLQVVEQINASKADLLFVAMGSPKQEHWIWRHREAIDASFCMGVGGSFDVASGNLTRAPRIFQKTGTEFLFQLVTEPRKRWPRQKVYFPFMLKVIGKKVFGSPIPTVARKGLAKE